MVLILRYLARAAGFHVLTILLISGFILKLLHLMNLIGTYNLYDFANDGWLSLVFWGVFDILRVAMVLWDSGAIVACG